jgi:hypothetical protein
LSTNVARKLGTIAFPIMVAATDDAYSIVQNGISGYTAKSNAIRRALKLLCQTGQRRSEVVQMEKAGAEAAN